jgi:transcriptional adapter 2-alpha
MSRILTTTESLQQRNKSQSLENDSEFWDDLEDNDSKKESVKKEEPPITQGGTALGYSFPELAGYMPLRGDFETEYENDAETVLCEMAFNEEDSKEDIENKLKLIEAYNKKLDERIKRKRFIIDNGLLEYKKKDKKRSKEEKEVYDRMRQFLRLMNKEEHNQLTNAILVEKQIRKRIEELKKYRRLGLHTLQEASDYEEEKKKKDFNEMVRKRESGVIPTTRNSSRWLPTSSKVEKLQEKHTKPKIRKPGSPLDIQGSPGYDLLSEKERELCATIRIFPQQYTLIKDTLIRESIRQGYLKKAIARQLIKIGMLICFIF